MKLYRGENIINGNPEKLRLIRQCISRDGFPSDFLNGGNPYRVMELGIFDATILHTLFDFKGDAERCSKKHFVSFSESKTDAERFAVTHYSGGVEQTNDYEILEDYYAEDIDPEREIFDQTLHLIVELDTAGKQPISPGCEYAFTLTYNNGHSKLFLLDVVKYLEFELRRRSGAVSSELKVQVAPIIQKIEFALELARDDKEWLVLSLDIIESPGSPPSHSAILKNGDPLQYKYYVEPDWFTR